MNYYNEFDPKAAAWLRQIIKEGLIPNGEVDTRSIVDVQPADLVQYTQCHFFAGIGGWSYALQLAGWPEDKPVWTGSCPCQPYSTAGKRKGNDDERNLWSHFYRLIKECRPDVVFGEQVAAAIGYGWLDGISSDLEVEGYACGAVVLGAHSVGAPHIRQRLYWVAESEQCGRRGRGQEVAGEGFGQDETQRSISIIGLPDTKHDGSSGADGDGEATEPQEPGRKNRVGESEGGSGLQIWDYYRIAECRDGKYRRIPIESEIFPLVDGFPARVAVLRGVGNAIVPQVAAEFINVYIEKAITISTESAPFTAVETAAIQQEIDRLEVFMLTKEALEKMHPGLIIDAGVIHDARLYRDPVRWVAVKGGGPVDWAIYYNTVDHPVNWIRMHGEKVTTEAVIRELVPCDQEAFDQYRQ